MGDVVSAPFGYLVAGFSLWGRHDHIFPLWMPVLIFSPFFLDAGVTLVRRLFQKEKIWEAHRSHFYQRLAVLGWSHKKTVLAEYFFMSATGLSAILLFRLSK